MWALLKDKRNERLILRVSKLVPSLARMLHVHNRRPGASLHNSWTSHLAFGIGVVQCTLVPARMPHTYYEMCAVWDVVGVAVVGGSLGLGACLDCEVKEAALTRRPGTLELRGRKHVFNLLTHVIHDQCTRTTQYQSPTDPESMPNQRGHNRTSPTHTTYEGQVVIGTGSDSEKGYAPKLGLNSPPKDTQNIIILEPQKKKATETSSLHQPPTERAPRRTSGTTRSSRRAEHTQPIPAPNMGMLAYQPGRATAKHHERMVQPKGPTQQRSRRAPISHLLETRKPARVEADPRPTSKRDSRGHHLARDAVVGCLSQGGRSKKNGGMTRHKPVNRRTNERVEAK
ncbi:hypothetical protein DFP72DRAFT_1102042 [Ephemerocybe angulata]|uniref:Uncharacterized protein n=1 Tax=Ephemerocybe angulata TaxID=980116 RepID=A0A8H6LWB1_9AGAR|nr:hypothetical protein DFP72DRAFT_1102042 [Tulosesus angulatus]